MDVCSQCGHDLGIGRFCTNCGHPVGADAPDGGSRPERGQGRTDTADRPRDVPAPAPVTPTAARYPLYADEAPTTGSTDGDTATSPAPAPAPATEPETTGRHRHVDESRRHGAAAGWVPWLAGLTVMLLLATLGLWLLLGGDDEPSATERATDPARTQEPRRDTRTPRGRATVPPAPTVEPGDLTASATPRTPRAAPPAQDVSGAPVTFVPGNLLDGLPETSWRMTGDGTGESITFSFDRPTAMTEVGLVNGYAKTASNASGTYDWYAGNRRILQVEWTFDDGTMVTQDLRQTRKMQTVALGDGVVTEQVTMRLLAVSPPGTGRAARDYTAVSEVSLQGAPT